MEYRFFCFGKNASNLELSLENKVIGAASTSFVNQIADGDCLFMYVNSQIHALVKVVGNSFQSSERVWPNKLYPFRLKIEVLEIFSPPLDFLSSPCRDDLYEEFGKGWGYQFLYSPKPIPKKSVAKLLKTEFLETTI